MSNTARVATPKDLPDWLLARGRPWIANEDIAQLLDVSSETAGRVAGRWHTKALAFSPTNGLQILIPPEFRSWGVVPADQFVDPMMRHLGHPYYVGFLSAAEIHGAAHQRPQVFQVITSERVRDRQYGRVRVEFFTSAATSQRPTTIVNVPTGTVTISTVETTVLDLVAHPRRGGGTSNVATIVGELLDDDKIDVTALTALSDHYPASVVHRSGWIIDFMAEVIGANINTDMLNERIDRRSEPTPLIASQPRRGIVDPRWNVYINGDVEPDL